VPSSRPGATTFFSHTLAAGAGNSIYAFLEGGFIYRFDATTGENHGVAGNPLDAFIPTSAPVFNAVDGELDAAGFLAVAASDSSPVAVVRLHPEPGASLSTTVDSPPGSTALPVAIAVGPDGNLYVGAEQPFATSADRGEILRYDGTTGAPLPAP